MNVYIGKSKASGVIMAPPSKSLAHRYIICAALSKGTSYIDNVDLSEDIKATLDCVKELGAEVAIDGRRVKLDGIDYNKIPDVINFKCRESGSTMRFFMGIAMCFGKKSRFYGSTTLRNRPFGIYEEICANQGIEFIRQEDSIYIDGKLNSGEYAIKGNISSQFITGLMYVLPILEGDSRIKLIPPIESKSYINLTIQAMRQYGIEVSWVSETELSIPGGQNYKACDAFVEGDCSNAAFLEALNYIGGGVRVEGLNPNSIQGDRVYKELFERLKNKQNHPEDIIDISDCPDLGPVLFAVAAALHGGTFTGTKRLKIKESDRGTVMCEELMKFGITSDIYENDIVIHDCELKMPKEILEGHNDHRIVMSEAILLMMTSGKIDGAQAVRKSYPGFFEDIKSLGVEVETDGMD